MSDSFAQKLLRAAETNQSLLCIGLDPDPDLMPLDDVFEFNRAIVDATKDLVCAYKPNVAFYDALGKGGHDALRRTLNHIPSDIPVIGDSKRGDIDAASRFHARAMFEIWDFDAATVNPYGGRDAVQPFLDHEDRGILVWCRSSNEGAKEFQDLIVQDAESQEQRPLYEWIAIHASDWNDAGNVGLVVGATYPDELGRVRELCPDVPILIPGIGAQRGALEESIRNGIDKTGRNAVFNVSRGVIYASTDIGDFEDAAHSEANALRERINYGLEMAGRPWPQLTPVGDLT